MNAFSLLRATEYIGAKELRMNLDKILRCTDHPYRVMLRNKPAVAILPDAQYIELLEILEEIKDSGLLEKTRKKLQEESKKKHPWFWSEVWQKAERKAESDIAAGRVRRFNSARALIKDLHR
ncbi:MAG: hypothetical protein A3G41_07705 [Elusimicrobia bacterium RIFCSPLOWO2_12_FULL_59_9]|nr:MAG: hypothetical protein A3G41_07705 [Elusimicrobia bacterium RIFCSPLOWO2_12_FULL_59_9]